MRFRRKITARTTALAVALGLVAVLVTALPAFAAIPTIALSPTSGVPGTPVTITASGGDFTTGGNASAVKFNGTAASFSITDATHIATSVPCGATTGNVIVTTSGGDTAAGVTFTVSTAPAPTITSFSPTAGTAGSTSVVITGTNLCGATVVLFNATTATTKTVNSSTQITATVPTGATTGPIHVTTPISTVVSTTSFTVGLPVITSFTPTIGLAGTAVTITGSNFLNATAVNFNGVTATFSVISATSISTTVPAGATTGPIHVTNAVGIATGGTFTVGVPTHSRSVTFSYHGHRASGNVSVGDGFSACLAFVPVYIQQLRNGSWKLLDTTATNGSGAYNTWVPDKSGLFRARVQHQKLLDGSSCGGDLSPTRHHS